MTIAATTAAAATTATSTASAAASSSASTAQSAAEQQLTGNFDTFLTLLTTQLQNQDPLSPMDSTQFTQQLVEFSQVEQQINSNNNLQTLINQGSSAAASNAVNYLGRTVTVTNGNAALSGGSASWTYNLGANAAQTVLSVTDPSGNVVYSQAGETTAGNNTFSWNGENTAGTQLPDGVYKLTVGSTASDGSTVQSTVASSGVVGEIDMSSGTPQLVIGPMEIQVSDVSGVQ